MKVSKLLKNIPHFVLQGDENIPVTGICDDSRKCTYGNLFICVLGESVTDMTIFWQLLNMGHQLL